MTSEEIGGVVRAIATALVGYAAGKGWIATGDTAAIIAGVAAIAVSVWSVVSKRKAA